MKKLTLITGALALLLAVLCIVGWQRAAAERRTMEALCRSSAAASLECFEEYSATGRESDYMSGVAEFRSYMKAYLFLNDNKGDAEYTWCNTVYGYMTLSPEKMQANLEPLISAREHLAEDYDHPNGFNLIHVCTNQLKHGE